MVISLFDQRLIRKGLIVLKHVELCCMHRLIETFTCFIYPWIVWSRIDMTCTIRCWNTIEQFDGKMSIIIRSHCTCVVNNNDLESCKRFYIFQNDIHWTMNCDKLTKHPWPSEYFFDWRIVLLMHLQLFLCEYNSFVRLFFIIIIITRWANWISR